MSSCLEGGKEEAKYLPTADTIFCCHSTALPCPDAGVNRFAFKVWPQKQLTIDDGAETGNFDLQCFNVFLFKVFKDPQTSPHR